MKFLKFKILLILLIFSVVLFVSCYGYQQSSSAPRHKNLSFLYNPNAVTIHPKYNIYHIDNENSELNIQIFKKELFFVKSQKGKYSNINIKYKIYNSFKSKVVADSSTLSFNLSYTLTKDTINLSIPLNLKKDSTYSAIIYLTDLVRERKETSYLFINKKWYSSENYKIFNLQNNEIIYNNWLSVNNKYVIKSDIHKNKKIYISYYNNKFKQALPPFSSNSFKLKLEIPDTTWVLTDTIEFPQKGIYLLRTDTNRQWGAVLNVFSKNYPKSTTPMEMIEPLRYLTSSKEYKKIITGPNKKIEVDKYWLNRTGNKTRAKELIRIYYTRQKLANKYFTSYKQGWKTDRGMIYMIYGDPTIVYKSDVLEKWIYGENQTNAGLIFLFEKNVKSITQNDYILKRSVNYKTSWYQTVDTWRNGRAFTIVN